MLEDIKTSLSRRARAEDGATAVEYALMVAAIAALIIVVVFALGGTVNDTFECTQQSIESQSGSC